MPVNIGEPLVAIALCFATNNSDNPLKLFNHADTKIVRHIKVKGVTSPMDGNLIYWSSRMGKHPDLPRSKAFLLHRQKGKCSLCGLYFREGDRLERNFQHTNELKHTQSYI